MNKVYRIIWSKTRNCYVVVSELAKRNAKGSGARSCRMTVPHVLSGLLVSAFLAGGIFVPAAWADNPHEIPENALYVYGTGITVGSGNFSSAWGNEAKAYGQYATAFGSGTAGVAGDAAKGAYATAWGNGTTANTEGATAWGSETTAGSGEYDNTVYSGTYATAWGSSTQALGNNATAWGNSSLALGKNATAWGSGSIALGDNATAFGVSSKAYGNNSLAALGGITNADGAVAIGIVPGSSGTETDTVSKAFGAYSLAALGGSTEADAKGAVAIGKDAKAELAYSIALGQNSVANRNKGVTGYQPGVSFEDTDSEDEDIGKAWKSTDTAVSVGASANDGNTATVTRQITGVAAGTYDTDAVNVAQLKAAEVHYVSIKSANTDDDSNYYNNGATGLDSIAIGPEAVANTGNAIAIGAGAQASTPGDSSIQGQTIAIGTGATANGWNAIAIGNATKAEYTGESSSTGTEAGFAIAIGNDAAASGNHGIAIGNYAETTKNFGFAIGNHASASGNYGFALGNEATVSGNYGFALGNNASAGQDYGVALGDNANSGTDYSHGTALGSNTKVNVESGVALGAYSTAARQKGVPGFDPVTGRQSEDASITWTSTGGAVAVGNQEDADRTQDITRQITDVAAGWRDTDAVNVAQLKKAQTHYYSVNSIAPTDPTDPEDHSNYLNDGAEGTDAIAIGPEVTASGDYSIAIGQNSHILRKSEGDYGIVLGHESGVTADYGIAIGQNTHVLSDHAIALGSHTEVNGKSAVALGNGVNATDDYSTALGSNTKVDVESGVALGYGSVAARSAGVQSYDPLTGGAYDVAAAIDAAEAADAAVAAAEAALEAAKTSGDAAAIADAEAALANANIAAAEAYKELRPWKSSAGAVSVGSMGETDNPKGGKITRQITDLAAGSEDTDAVNVAQLKKVETHYFSVNSTTQTVQTGTSNYMNDGAKGTDAIAIGPEVTATGNYSIAIGQNSHILKDSTNEGDYGIVLGQKSGVAADYGIVIGNETYNYGEHSIALGSNTEVTGDNAVALGSWVKAKGNNSIVIGNKAGSGDPGEFAERKGAYSVVIGNEAKSYNNYGTAIGNNADAGTDTSYGTALGNNTKVSVDSGVALGSDSVATIGGGTAGYDPLNRDHKDETDGVWKSTRGAVSVGGTVSTDDGQGNTTTQTITRQITNVAAGKEDTDAVNVAQLKAAVEAGTGGGGTTHFYGVGSSEPAAGNYNGDGAAGENALAAGVDAEASGDNATAVGTGAKAKADDAIAIGTGAKAKEMYSIAIGAGAKAKEMYSIAIGSDATAKGAGSIALGSAGATAVGPASMAWGENTKAKGDLSTAFGLETVAGGNYATAWGTATKATGDQATAFGLESVASGDNATAFGDSSKAAGENSLAALGGTTNKDAEGSMAIGEGARAKIANTYAIGKNAVALGNDTIAIGNDAAATAESAAAFGDHAEALALRSIAIGNSAGAENDYGIAIGGLAKAKAVGGIALGTSANATGANATAVGNSSKAEGVTSVALGQAADAKGESAISIGTASEADKTGVALGHTAQAAGESSIALGTRAQATTTAIAAGHMAKATGESGIALGTATEAATTAVALGHGAKATEESAIALGTNATAAKTGISIGHGSKASGESGVAIGTNSSADTTGVALGHGSSAISGGVALGMNSKATTNSGVTGYDPLTQTTSTKNDATWKATLAALSVGGDGQTRQISNVAAGTNDTDAVNVAQLKKAGTHYYSVNSEDRADDSNFLNDGATGTDAIAAGVGAAATAESAAAFGDHAAAIALRSIAIGNSAGAENDYGIAIGGRAKAKAEGGIALGTSAEVSGANATAVGNSSKAEGVTSVALGQAADAKGESAISIGTSSEAARTGLAAGHMAKATGESSIALGTTAEASTTAIAAGHTAKATGESGIALGTATEAHTTAIAMGHMAKAKEESAIALGTNANAAKTGISIGHGSKATGESGVAIGTNSSAATTGVALGHGSSAISGGVALGMNSKATTNSGVTGYDPATQTTSTESDATWKATLAALSVGGDGQTRQITNVAAGAELTDAVNVAQLKAARTELQDGTNTTVTTEKDTTDGHTVYKVNAYKSVVQAKAGETNVTVDPTVTDDGLTTTYDVSVKDMHVKEGVATYGTVDGGTEADGKATLTHQDGTTAEITGLKNTYTKSATFDAKTKKATFTRNDTTTYDLDLSAVSTGDYRLIGDGATHDQAYVMKDDGTVTLNVQDQMSGAIDQVTIRGLVKPADMAAARTEVKAGTNVKVATDTTTAADGHTVYTVNTDDLKYKVGTNEAKNVKLQEGLVFIDGENTTAAQNPDGSITFNTDNLTYKVGTNAAQSVALKDGLHFVNGTNTKAVQNADGSIQFDATHNRLTEATVTPATESSNAMTAVLKDADGNEITVNLQNTYTTVTKEGNKVTFSRNDGVLQTISLGDLGASDYHLVPASGGNYKADSKGVVTMQVKDALNAEAAAIDVKIEDVASKAQQDINTQNITTNRADLDAGWNAKAGGSIINVNPANKDLNFAGADEHVTVTADDTTRTIKVGVTGLAGEDLSNITEDGKTVVTNIARDAITVEGEDGIEVTQSQDKSKYTVKAKLAENLTLREGNIDLANIVKIGNGTDVHTVTIDGTKGEVTGLTNTTWSKDGVYNAGRAATEEQLQDLYEAAKKDAVDSVKLKFEGESGDTLERGNNETLRIVGDGSNITTKAADDKIQIELSRNLNVDSITAGNTGINKEGVKADKVTVGNTVMEDGKVSVGATTIEENKITMGDTTITNNSITTETVTADEVTVGDTTLNSDGLTIDGGPSVTKDGIDAGNKKITAVANGTEDTDAVNLSQLKEAVSGSRTEVKGGTNVTVTTDTTTAADGHTIYTVNADGASVSAGSDAVTVTGAKDTTTNITDYKVDLSDTAKAALDKAEKDGLTFKGDTGTSNKIKLGDTLSIKGGASGALSDGNIGVEGGGDTLNIKLAKDIKGVDTLQVNKSVKVGNTAIEDNKMTMGDTVITNSGVTANRFTSGDTTLSSDGLTVAGGPSVTKKGVDAGGQKVTNVAPGEADTDAANMGQLRELADNAGNVINKVGNEVNRLDDRMRKGLAGAAALAALHPIEMDNKFAMGLGYGNYHSANAMAMGLFYRPQDNLLFSIGGSMGNGENMMNAGITIALDKGFNTSKAVMAKQLQTQGAVLEEQRKANAEQEAKIQTLKAENAAIKEQNAKLEARLAAIEAKLAE